MVKSYDLEREQGSPPHLVTVKEYNSENDTMRSPAEIAEFLCNVFRLDKKMEEYCYVISLDAALHPNGVFFISKGLMEGSLISAREIFSRLLLCGACKFVIVHNHPSGSPSPSQEDKKITQTLKEAGDIMNIKLIDHLIICSKDSFFSFYDTGNL